MISLTNRAVSALYSVLPQLKASKDQRLSIYKDAPFAAIKFEVWRSYDDAKYASPMKKPNGVKQGAFLMRKIKSLDGSSSSNKYYVCTVGDVIAIIPWLQRMCDVLLEKYYQNFAFCAYLRNMSRLQTRNASYLTFEDFALVAALLDLLLEFAPIHYNTRDDYYRADSKSGDRLLGSPLEQLLIMERESPSYNSYDTVFASNLLMNSLCVQHREKMQTISWNGYTTPLKLPVINSFFWDINGFSLGMLQSRVLMLSTPTGGNPAWGPGSFYYALKRITGMIPFNSTSCPMLNKELSASNAVDDLTFDRIRRALVLISSLSFNGQFYLSANYGTPPKTQEPLYIRKSCPKQGSFVRIRDYYVQIPSFVIDRSSASYSKDEDCSFSQSPIPRFYSGNGNLAKSEKGYGCYAKNKSTGETFKGHFHFKDAYNDFLKYQSKPIISLLQRRRTTITQILRDNKFSLIINGVEHPWPNEVAKAMAYLFVNNIADKRLDNEFEQKQALMTVIWACDSPGSSFGGFIIAVLLQWYSTLIKLFTSAVNELSDPLNYIPDFPICKYYTTKPDFSSSLARDDFFKYVADDAARSLKLDEDKNTLASIIAKSSVSSNVYIPGSMIADASVVYGEVSITDPDLLSALPSRTTFISAQFDTSDFPENVRIPGAYDVYEQDLEEDSSELSLVQANRGRSIMLDRLNWRVIFDQRRD